MTSMPPALPPRALRALGYVELRVSDLARWRHFATAILGLQEGVLQGDGAIGLRMDAREQRIVLRPADGDGLSACGWELAGEDELLQYVGQLRAQGVAVDEVDRARRRARGVARLFDCADPVLDLRHEFYCGAHELGPTQAFQSPLARGGFMAGPLGMGHVALSSPDYARSADFYRRVLGLGVSGYADIPLPDGGRFEATFLFAWSGRHHALALLPGTQPQPTRHLMVEYRSMDDVGLAHERCCAAGIPIERDLGVHEGDSVFSFYAQTPSGFLMEIGWGSLVGTDWGPPTLRALSRWGHRKRPG